MFFVTQVLVPPTRPALLIALRIAESGGEPLETLVETVARSGTGGLDELRALAMLRRQPLRRLWR